MSACLTRMVRWHWSKLMWLMFFTEITTSRSALWRCIFLWTWRFWVKSRHMTWKWMVPISWWLRRIRRNISGKTISVCMCACCISLNWLCVAAGWWRNGGFLEVLRIRPKPFWTASMRSYRYSGCSTLMRKSWRCVCLYKSSLKRQRVTAPHCCPTCLIQFKVVLPLKSFETLFKVEKLLVT